MNACRQKHIAHCAWLFVFILMACNGRRESANADSTSWKLFRGNPSLSGYTDTHLPDQPVLIWTYKGGTRSTSSPIVESGTTYWCDKRGLVRGIDSKGQLVFEYDMQTAVEATPMIHDSILYIGRIDGIMAAISLAAKDTVWTYETMGQVSASPNVTEFEGRKAIVFGSYDNYLYCVDAGNGEVLSKFKSGYYLNGAAALWNGHVVFGGCDSWVRIVDCKTGIQTDSMLLDAYVPASPAIADDCCCVGDYSGNMYLLELDRGRIARHRKILSPDSVNGSYVSVPAVSDDACYFFSGERHLQAVGRTDGATRWRYMMKGNAGESSPVVCNDKIIACTKTGIVSILRATDGQLLWEYDAGEPIVGSPAVIKDYFMILTAKGTLLCFGEAPENL